MNRISKILLLAIMMMVVAVVPAYGQDDDMMEPTIADIVVASATDEEAPEFTALLAAVQAADPLVLEALADPEADWTVFAPTDAAFAALGEETLAAVLGDPALLTEILLYHVVEQSASSELVVDILDTTDGSFTIDSLQGQYLDIAGNLEDGITIDSANLVLEMVDIEAANGIIHVIDAVLLPEDRTIAEIVVENAGDEEAPEFTALLAAVGAADPLVLEALSATEMEDGEAVELTVFAPTDAAFAALGEETLAAVLGDPTLVTDILLYHVTEGIVSAQDAAELLNDNMGEAEVPMLNEANATLSIDMESENIFINDATIIITNIDAANGIIHVIDAVILPPAEEE